MMAKRSPPMPTFIGSTRLSTAAVATAASMALPPFFRISSPACAASGWLVATMPLRPMTSERLCGSQPSDRSPSTALHHAGLGSELHNRTGDCGAAVMQTIAAIAHRTKTTENSLGIFPLLDWSDIIRREGRTMDELKNDNKAGFQNSALRRRDLIKL